MKKLVVIIIGIVVMASLIARLLFSENENAQICKNGKWIGLIWCESRQKCLFPWQEYCEEHPEQFTAEKMQVQKYIEDNIVNLSPAEPVLGGSWNKPDVRFLDKNVVEVTYEDGHIQEKFQAKYQVQNSTVVLSKITRITE